MNSNMTGMTVGQARAAKTAHWLDTNTGDEKTKNRNRVAELAKARGRAVVDVPSEGPERSAVLAQLAGVGTLMFMAANVGNDTATIGIDTHASIVCAEVPRESLVGDNGVIERGSQINLDGLQDDLANVQSLAANISPQHNVGGLSPGFTI